MKRMAWIIAAALLLSGCSTGERNITFAAAILEVYDAGLLVETSDDLGFDRASVGYCQSLALDFTPIAGQQVEITIKPEIRESYPVQVTAVKIKLLEDVNNTEAQYQKITPEEAKEKIDAGGAIILDVRTEDEFAKAHIGGALLIPDYDIEAHASGALPDKDAVILVYCRSGRRSADAAKTLIEMGYTAVYDFGGIIDWRYETVTGK